MADGRWQMADGKVASVFQFAMQKAVCAILLTTRGQAGRIHAGGEYFGALEP
jgi:hypothetical protein